MKRTKSKAGRKGTVGRLSARAIYWAIDPFHDDKSFHIHAARVLKPIAESLHSSITPVSFVDAYRAFEEPGHYFPLIPFSSEPIHALRKSAENFLVKIGPADMKAMLTRPVLLSHDQVRAPSLREKVAAIDKAARDANALFVAFHSHSQRGLKRLFLGSFAETFVLQATIPTLIINPQCRPSARPRQILFATDFSKESLLAFDSISELAVKLRSKLSVVHYFHIPALSLLLQRSARKDFQEELKRKERAARSAGASLTEKGAKMGLEVNFHLLTDRQIFDPCKVILSFAKRQKADLIALTSQSGTLRTALVGAISRELVRSALCPVLIYKN